MNLLSRLFKAPERRYLRSQIEAERPDLRGLPFIDQLRTYQTGVLDNLIAIGITDGQALPALYVRSLEYRPDHSPGYYRALYLLNRAEASRLQEENHELREENDLLSAERSNQAELAHQLSVLAKQTSETLANATDPIIRQN